MSEFRANSFDPPRQRSAPTSFVATSLAGDTRKVVLDQTTLIVAVKANCDGCRDFIEDDLTELSEVSILVLAFERDDEWREARREVLVAPEFLKELDVRSAPFYLVIDPSRELVLTEGVLFGAEQVARDLASHRLL